jgi:hypothetical protein
MKLDGNMRADRELGYAPLPGVPHGNLPALMHFPVEEL